MWIGISRLLLVCDVKHGSWPEKILLKSVRLGERAGGGGAVKPESEIEVQQFRLKVWNLKFD